MVYCSLYFPYDSNSSVPPNVGQSTIHAPTDDCIVAFINIASHSTRFTMIPFNPPPWSGRQGLAGGLIQPGSRKMKVLRENFPQAVHFLCISFARHQMTKYSNFLLLVTTRKLQTSCKLHFTRNNLPQINLSLICYQHY